MSYSLYKPIRIGFVPLSDCAPLIMARELGLFDKYNLNVQLKREIGWAAIRDKIIYGELDAAHALAAMPFAATIGLGSVPCDCVTGMVMSLHGNGITLSKDLYQRGVKDLPTLRCEIERTRGDRMLNFGVVFPYSTHHFLLRSWLASGGIDPDRDVNIVIVPAPSTFANLKSGNLDGYCVGEPWNTMAIKNGIGWGAATSIDLAPRHPEKVLMTRKSFAETNRTEHAALIAAIIEACQWCDQPENRARLIETLGKSRYVNVPYPVIRESLHDTFDYGMGRHERLPDFHVFHRYAANDPSPDKAAWVVNNLIRPHHKQEPLSFAPSLLNKVFRQDLYLEGLALTDKPLKPLEPETENELETAHC